MSRLPEPRLTLVYRLEAVLGEPLDLGEVRVFISVGGRLQGGVIYETYLVA